MTIMHPAPLGATTRTEVTTTPAGAYVDAELGDDGYPYLAVRNLAGDVIQVLRIGEGDPADQHELARAMAAAWAKAAERFAALEVEAGGR